MRNQDYEYVRSYYGVPARKGARVRHPGSGDGTVTHAGGHYIWITWDATGKERGPYHPTDEIEYLDKEGASE
jgi:hypothetical protein